MNKNNPYCYWFTGLSGSGKTTLATRLVRSLQFRNIPVVFIDGDQLRAGLNVDLAFTDAARTENIRRAAELSKIILASGVSVVASFISPTKEIRLLAEKIIGENHYVEIFVDTPIEICIDRDPKGLYKRALNGEIGNFTGITSEFQIPDHPMVVVDNNNQSIEEASSQIMNEIVQHCH